jgi:hypothetical protein
MPGSERQNSMFKKTKGYVQKNNPFPVTSCGRRRNTGSPLHNDNEPKKTTKGKGRNFRTVKEGAGMTEKGVAEYRRKNPGSKLGTAVTSENPSKKDKKRRDAFCARSRSWTSERGKAARRRWRC